MTTPSAFSGAIRLEIEFRVLGIMSKRRVQVNYTYTPPWPFLDADAATERSAPFALGFSLAVLTQPGVRVAIEDREPEWVPMYQILEWGVLSSRAHDKLHRLIDADARRQDQKRREKARRSRSSAGLPDLG